MAMLAGCEQLLDLDWSAEDEEIGEVVPGDEDGGARRLPGSMIAGSGASSSSAASTTSSAGAGGGSGSGASTSAASSTGASSSTSAGAGGGGSGSGASSTSAASSSASAGTGGGGGCFLASDCPGINGPCDGACVNGNCVVVDLPAGAPCFDGAELGVCDDDGNCVECLNDDDCNGGECVDGQCVVDLCHSGQIDGAETDVDCGGPVCKKCGEGKGCLVGTDCKEGVCAAGVCDKNATGGGN